MFYLLPRFCGVTWGLCGSAPFGAILDVGSEKHWGWPIVDSCRQFWSNLQFGNLLGQSELGTEGKLKRLGKVLGPETSRPMVLVVRRGESQDQGSQRDPILRNRQVRKLRSNYQSPFDL